VTGTSVNSSSDTYLTQCSVTGIGGFQLRILSDSSGDPVTGETINAVDRLGCDVVGQAGETQVVYIDNFSVGQGGWLTPVFPSQAEPGGQLDIAVTYQGQTYSLSPVVPPIGTKCVTLLVPSGFEQSVTTMSSPCAPNSLINAKNTISLSGFSIATSGTVLPTPYLSGQIFVNASAGVTWSSYTLYTNSTDCGTRPLDTSTTLNYFAYFFQGSPCGQVTAGDTYLITFVVAFTDGTNDTASVSVTAD
jgi:hypothetical protein